VKFEAVERRALALATVSSLGVGQADRAILGDVLGDCQLTVFIRLQIISDGF
jgi:hypothetical protein